MVDVKVKGVEGEDDAEVKEDVNVGAMVDDVEEAKHMDEVVFVSMGTDDNGVWTVVWVIAWLDGSLVVIDGLVCDTRYVGRSDFIPCLNNSRAAFPVFPLSEINSVANPGVAVKSHTLGPPVEDGW